MSNGNISRRANIFPFPPYLNYYEIIKKKEIEGKRIYNLFKMRYHYNYPEFKEEIDEEKLIEIFRNFFNIPNDFKIIVFPGTISALSTIFFTLFDTNDEVLVPEPVHPLLMISSEISQVRLKIIKTYYYNNFSIPLRDFIEPLINPRVKGFFIFNPQFFSGNVYSDEEIERIVFFSNTYKIPLIFDETFSFSTFKDVFFNSISKLRINHNYKFLVNRIVESYSGINLTFIATTIPLYVIIKRYRDVLFPVDSLLINSAYSFLTKFFNTINNVRQKIFENADYIYKTLLSKDISVIKPHAGPCLIIKLPVKDTDKFIEYMLEVFEENGSSVFLMPMTEFFIEKEKGKELLTLNFSNIEKIEVEEGMRLLKSGINNYLKEVL
uniref:Aminotransferase class I/II-fold pyridoxal phosphate-dependent enzyme n=1 Tax=candidate division WOR-3 bacterium TaxID=2052148 RepID=A0A7C4Y652_UNCW3